MLLAGSRARILIAVLFFFIVFNLNASHEICLDFSFPYSYDSLSFCSSYNLASSNTSTCCTGGDDVSINNAYLNEFLDSSNGPSTSCAIFMKDIMCSKCDAWSLHLFDGEMHTSKKFPTLCKRYCSDYYDSCATVPLATWDGPLSSIYETKELFCSAYGLSDTNTYCYGGSPYKPAPAIQVSPSLVEAFPLLIDQISSAFLVDMRYPPNVENPKLYLVDKGGLIYSFENNPSVSTYSVELDISRRISKDGELGLLGLTFDPQWPTRPWIYVYYTLMDYSSVISRFDLSSNAEKEEILLTFAQPFANHKAGWVGFGKDNLLYISTGDGGSADDPYDNGQNLSNLLGKMLRIDVSGEWGTGYSIPTTNPFSTGDGITKKMEIYAYGLRNPWRCSFDSENGDLWCGDVVCIIQDIHK
eukprot:TRINITY_DN3659_c0_g1_i5.p1 TRINITY_DN3659_c0_g1~~TRINITY_DN3659_c0_g1_i5.p1  ORF type:complete len:414 (-),score=25.73 TRINITY_DN3659_c0_g1_i5:29-1270(-)